MPDGSGDYLQTLLHLTECRSSPDPELLPFLLTAPCKLPQLRSCSVFDSKLTKSVPTMPEP